MATQHDGNKMSCLNSKSEILLIIIKHYHFIRLMTTSIWLICPEVRCVDAIVADGQFYLRVDAAIISKTILRRRLITTLMLVVACSFLINAQGIILLSCFISTALFLRTL